MYYQQLSDNLIALAILWHSLLQVTVTLQKPFIVFQGIPGQPLSVYSEEIIFLLSSQDLGFLSNFCMVAVKENQQLYSAVSYFP